MAATKVATNASLNTHRDHQHSMITTLAVGTSNAAPNVADTALGGQAWSGAATPEDGGVGEVTHYARLGLLDAVGSTLQETGGFDAMSALNYRIVHAPVVKTNQFEVEFRVKSIVKNG